MTESGKLYAWGIRGQLADGAGVGLLSSAEYGSTPAWPVLTGGATDTTAAVRKPRLLTVSTETSLVDFDANGSGTYNYAMAVGSSGNAYFIDGRFALSFAAIPKPAGVSGTFKYTNVWLPANGSNQKMAYLKGNDGKIYYTGVRDQMSYTGVPSLYNISSSSNDEIFGNIATLVPVEVPFPAGEDIVMIRSFGKVTSVFGNNCNLALSASGKGYITGAWKGVRFPGAQRMSYYSAPLKNTPVTGTELEKMKLNASVYDTVYYLKKFVEVALPAGATKLIGIASPNQLGSTYVPNVMVIDDRNRVYWSGAVLNNVGINGWGISAGNFLSVANDPNLSPDECADNFNIVGTSPSAWDIEAINFRGAAYLGEIGTQVETYSRYNLFIISRSRRGYFVGDMGSHTGAGKLGILNETGGGLYTSPFPVPIANEQLLDCNTSPGTGGPLGPTTPNSATGTIDCSKTMLAPAPILGTAGQTDLIVTITVSATGTFSPVSVTGSGMSLANGITTLTATRTGTQQFHIPLNYDGTALTSNFQFTIGTAGSCSPAVPYPAELRWHGPDQ
ncbi:hypothetical protein BLX24_14420 [Arsenicibacter rosenii]|uniref:Uncharacterized protein n=1 Tax=Arsenicibacter rosenii TaxID=1750698 RepID=A0A1S2VKJ7_9BACT|nr:hypothetical protein BLX24_14420 [Arsenicibacter rosenii]